MISQSDKQAGGRETCKLLMQPVRELQLWFILSKRVVPTGQACTYFTATPAPGEDQGGTDQQAQHWDQLQGGLQDGAQLGQREEQASLGRELGSLRRDRGSQRQSAHTLRNKSPLNRVYQKSNGCIAYSRETGPVVTSQLMYN